MDHAPVYDFIGRARYSDLERWQWWCEVMHAPERVLQWLPKVSLNSNAVFTVKEIFAAVLLFKCVNEMVQLNEFRNKECRSFVTSKLSGGVSAEFHIK